MKITTGKLKGRSFFIPKGIDIRPTQNLVRKAIFDILGQDLTGVSFLDLFAGSGGVGLEAYSRGAAYVALVENDLKCTRVIEKNIALLEESFSGFDAGCIELIAADIVVAIQQLADLKKKFHIVFLDPPYTAELGKKALKEVSGCDILHPDSIIIIEHHKREILPENEGSFFAIKKRIYGSSVLTIYKNHQ